MPRDISEKKTSSALAHVFLAEQKINKNKETKKKQKNWSSFLMIQTVRSII
jgi:hypothetical protein